MTAPPDEHESLDEDVQLDLDGLHVVTTCPETALPEPRLRRLLEREIRQLYTSLEAHFAREEEGQYMKAVLERAPNLDGDVAHLHAQHSEIRTRLLTLAEECASGALSTIRDRAAAILDLIGEHERGEVQLVENAR